MIGIKAFMKAAKKGATYIIYATPIKNRIDTRC